jgi:hypothetical protein
MGNMTRFRAASVHLAVSAAIAVSVFVLLWFVWYPNPFLEAAGGTNLFMMLLAIDVCLGPLLTLVVFKPGKRTLRFDLSVIAILQLAALAYGVYVFHLGRPVFVANIGFRFDVVRAIDIDVESLKRSGRPLPWFGPTWVGVVPPADLNDRERIAETTLKGGADLSALPEHYVQLESIATATLKESKSINTLRRINKGREREVDAWLTVNGLTEDSVKFLPLRAPAKDMAVIIDARSARVLAIAPFYPWD